MSKASPLLRPITDQDHAAVLALNQVNVHALAPMDQDRLTHLVALTDRADVLEVDGRVAGFVLTFASGTTYDSANYRWFSQRFPDGFYYLDRIVLDGAFRRRGLGGLVYDDIERTAAARHTRLCLEVNADPPNLASLAFHAQRGYAEVGRLSDGAKTVSLMSKDLA